MSPGVILLLGGFGILFMTSMIFGDANVTEDMKLVKPAPRAYTEYRSVASSVLALNESGGKLEPKLSEASKLQTGDFKKVDVNLARKQKEERLAELRRTRRQKKKELMKNVNDGNATAPEIDD